MRAKAKYDSIGETYDTSRCADPYLVSRLSHHLKIDPDKNYLDLACGSGNYTSALSAIGGKWKGLDQSSVMLEKARTKSESVQWFQGEVDSLPFEDNSFHGVICTLAIHHFESLKNVFCEVSRVMRSGRFICFTSTSGQMEGYWLNEYFPLAMQRSRELMPKFEDIRNTLYDAGFEDVEVDIYHVSENLKDFFLYSGKHRPEMYLDANVRAGISTFSSLAEPDEVAMGCERLAADIESGQINEVIAEYANDLGDYCFIIGE